MAVALPKTPTLKELCDFKPDQHSPAEFRQRVAEAVMPPQREIWDCCWLVAETIAAGDLALAVQQAGRPLEVYPELAALFSPSPEQELARGQVRLQVDARNELIVRFNEAHFRAQVALKAVETVLVRRQGKGELAATKKSVETLRDIAKLFDPMTGAFAISQLLDLYTRLDKVLKLYIEHASLVNILMAANRQSDALRRQPPLSPDVR